MKKVFSLLFAFMMIQLAAVAQQAGSFKIVTIKDSFYLNGTWIHGISNDTLLASSSQGVLPTVYAIKKYISRNASGVASVNGNTGAVVVDTGFIANFSVKVRSLFQGTNPLGYQNGRFYISQAYSGSDGYLSAADWITFNNKANPFTVGSLSEASSSVLNIIGGSNAVLGSGTSIQVKQASGSQSGYLSAADWNTFNNKGGTSVTGNLTEATSNVLTITGGTNAVNGSGTTLQIKQASGSQPGYLSTTDWTTFNNKLGTVDTTNIANFSVKTRSLFSATAPVTYINGVVSMAQATGSIPGYLSASDWTNFNSKLSTVDTTNIASFNVKVRSLFSATAPITYTNGKIGITQASASTNGYLSSTDWTTFNSKGTGSGSSVTYSNGVRYDSLVVTSGGGGGGSPGPGTSYTFNPDGSGRLIIDNTTGTYHAGDTLRLTGSYKVVQLTNFVGTLANPIVLMNTAGQVTNIGDSTWGGGSYSEGFLLMGCHYMQIRGTDSAHLIFTGSKNTTDDGNGYQVRGAYKDISLYGFSDHIELAYCWIRHGGQGIFAKMEVVAGDPRTWYSGGNALHGFAFHDLRLDSTYNEGMYLGHTGTFWNVSTNAPYYPNSGQAVVDTNTYKRPIYLTNVKVYNNLVRGTGFDGIQTATIDTLEVYNNEVINWGTRHVSTDCGGILIGGRTANTNIHDNVVHDAFGEPIQFYGNGYNSLNTTTGTYHTFLNNLIYRTEYGDGFSMAGYDNPIVTITNLTAYRIFNNSTRVNGTRGQTTAVAINKSYLILPYQHNTGTVFDSYYEYTENGGSFVEGTGGNVNGKYPTYTAAFSATGIDTLNYFLPTSGVIGFRSNGNLGPKAPASSGGGGTTTTTYYAKLGGTLTEHTNINLNGKSLDFISGTSVIARIDSTQRITLPYLANNSAEDSVLTIDWTTKGIKMKKVTSSGGSSNGTMVTNQANIATNYTIGSLDNVLLVNNTTALTITLPSAASTSGIIYTVKKTSNNTTPITVSTTSSQTIDGQTKVILAIFRENMSFKSDGSNWYVVFGNNTNPQAYAGPDQSITAGTTTATLTATASTISSRTVTYAWSQLSGPNTATQSASTALTNNLSGLAAGTYVFKFTATDNLTAFSTDTVNVVVASSLVSAAWKFSATDNTAITGVNNVLGSPITSGNYSATYTDASGSGIALVSLATSGTATTIWGTSYGATNNSGDANGETTSDGGGFIIPQGNFANAWWNYQKTTPVNQFKFTGLNPAKTYKITFVPSLKTSFGLDANPTQYQINGGTAQQVNAVGNTSHSVIFTGQVPTGAGELPWFVGPVATLSEFGMLNYVKIESEN